ncbi:PLP-dependent aminotransferase family protein [Bacteroidales bacterium]|nr:PLP-dependent aminotransferase family protein [Bacteroidales bacterium]
MKNLLQNNSFKVPRIKLNSLTDIANAKIVVDFRNSTVSFIKKISKKGNDSVFANRMNDVPKSFIREILKVAISKDVISFAGGLPNRALFPMEELQEATKLLFENVGRDALQYSNTEGYFPLREFISKRYKEKKGLEITTDELLITHGSQQALDLIGKVLVNEGDDVIIEEPGYLGAIQALSLFKPRFNTVTIDSEGMDLEKLKQLYTWRHPKLIYMVPNFQNPGGTTYSLERRKAIADFLKDKNTILIEDDPYGEIRYRGKDLPLFKSLLPERTISLGTFSKTAVPSFRIGWMALPEFMYDKFVIAKQAADLHTNFFSQCLLHEYLINNDIDKHIAKISDLYGNQADAMIESMNRYFPKEVKYTKPEGGMFLWVTLPEGLSSMALFDKAIKKNVAFVPGNPFYVNKPEGHVFNTLRLNFSCANEENIEIGIKRLGDAIKSLQKKSKII